MFLLPSRSRFAKAPYFEVNRKQPHHCTLYGSSHSLVIPMLFSKLVNPFLREGGGVEEGGGYGVKLK